jgi:hypothetical protein
VTLRLAAWTLDALLIVVGAAVGLIAVGGGGEFRVGGVLIRARSVGNPILLWFALAAARYALRRASPFLGLGRLPIEDIDGRSIGWLMRLRARLDSLDRPLAWRLVWVASASTLAVKVMLAAAHPGFFSGDDVEIHEMTMSALLGRDWPVWDLRNPFYPFVVVYPVQAVLAALGTQSPAIFVFGPRVAVAVLSTAALPLLYVAARRHASIPASLLAVACLAVSYLHTGFGSTELPRPVSAPLVLGAYLCLLSGSLRATAAAAVLIGLAAALRFSEIVFLFPAVLQLALERRVRDAALLCIGAAAVALAALGSSDLVYRGDWLHSLRAVVSFTLVDRLSSRGYEPVYYYLLWPIAWTNAVVLIGALRGISRSVWRPIIWFAVPAFVLSLGPHKEPRYLIPAMPFFSLVAGAGLLAVVNDLVVRKRTWTGVAAVGLIAAVPAATLFEWSRYDLGRTDADVAVAAAVRSGAGIRGVASDRLWPLGGRVYFKDVPVVRELDFDKEGEVEQAIEATTGIDIVLPTRSACARVTCDAVLRAAGFVEQVSDVTSRSDYRVYRRER